MIFKEKMETVYFSNKTFLMKVLVDDQELFCAKDVAKNIGYKRPENAVERHVPEKYKVRRVVPVSGTPQIFLKEAGLYELIFKSKLKQAKLFREWVFEEVLPSIRKTGSYHISNSERIKEIRDKTTRDSPDFQIIKFRGEDIHHKLKDPKKVEMGQKGGKATAQKYKNIQIENEKLKIENEFLENKIYLQDRIIADFLNDE